MEQVKEEQIKNGKFNSVGIYPNIHMRSIGVYLELFTYVRRDYKDEKYLVPLILREKLNGNFDIDHMMKIRDTLMLTADRIRLNAIPPKEEDNFEWIKIVK
jgi:hypothetical protein